MAEAMEEGRTESLEEIISMVRRDGAVMVGGACIEISSSHAAASHSSPADSREEEEREETSRGPHPPRHHQLLPAAGLPSSEIGGVGGCGQGGGVVGVVKEVGWGG